MIPFLSVCSGIGAPEVGWAPHGFHPVLGSEIEAFPRAVLAHRFAAEDARRRRGGPGPALWGDFTALRPRHLRRLGIPLPRVLVGGTPCQSFSVAGKRGSLSDPRGNLSLAYVRLAHALADALAQAPRTAGDTGPVFYAVWENVPGVLSTRDNAFGCFLGALVGGDAALVPPDARWGPVPCFDDRSHDVHRAYGWQSCRWPVEGMAEGPLARAAWRIRDCQYDGVPQRRPRVFVVVGFGAGADPAEVLFEPLGLFGDNSSGGSASEDLAGTLADGARRGGGYSHDDIPLVGEAYGGNNTAGPIDVATALSAHAGPHGRLDFASETFIAHTLRASDFDGSEDGTGRGIPLVPAYVADIVGTLVAGSNSTAGDRPPGMSAETASTYLVAFDTTQITSPECRMSPQAQAVASLFGVRRLMPRECERLQSFPDDHTLIPWRGRPAENCPDGPRYRACGNSMNVTVMSWLGARLAAQMRGVD